MTHSEHRTALIVFGVLIGLTGLTVASAMLWSLPRFATVALALTIAWAKAGLIGYHFMHLKSERPMVWVTLFIAVSAVLILAIGVVPDLSGRTT